MLVRRRDYLIVALGSARLNHRGDPKFRGDIQPIATAVDSTGASLYIGYFNDTVNFAGTGASGSEALTANNDSGYLGKLDANGAYVWAKKWSSAAGVYPLAVAIGASDSVFVAGQFLGTTNLGGTDIVSNGQYAAFVGKLDSAGNHVWSKAFGGSTGTQAYASSVSVVRGPVQTADAGTNTLTIAGVTIDTTTAAYRSATSATLTPSAFYAAATVGTQLKVRGTYAGGVLTATQVQLDYHGYGEDDGEGHHRGDEGSDHEKD